MTGSRNSSISALTVTLPTAHRFPLLQQSIDDFRGQTYDNRELVVVVNGGDAAVGAQVMSYVRELGDARVRAIEIPGLVSLGAARNASVAAAGGDYVCQWDDDDRHHRDRLTIQIESLRASGCAGGLLQQVVQIFPDRREAYCLNFHATPWRGMAGSLMCPRALMPRYPETGEESLRGEDTALLTRLVEAGGWSTVPDAPHLYLYRAHGSNTWPQTHHLMLTRELALSAGLLRRREQRLRDGLTSFGAMLDGYVVQGSNGPAFTL